MNRLDWIDASRDAARSAAESVMAEELATTIAHALNGVRCAILATIPEPESEVPPVDMWACVELFGHLVRYGHVTEVNVAGKRFLEVREPTIVHGSDGDADAQVFPEVRRRYHPNAVYGMSERTERDVIAVLRRQRGLTADVHPNDDVPF